jgi:hypothetical protein
VAGPKAAVFDSASRFWQGAPRTGVMPLIKGLPEPTIADQSTHDFTAVFARPCLKGRPVLRNDNGEA